MTEINKKEKCILHFLMPTYGPFVYTFYLHLKSYVKRSTLPWFPFIIIPTTVCKYEHRLIWIE